jgi:uncharacterized membrane protein
MIFMAIFVLNITLHAMQINFFKRFRKFLRTTLFGGVVALAPLTLIVLLFRWVINLIGLVVRTRLWAFLNRFEDRYLLKIPGYKLAKETVQQFFGKNQSFFKEVVLVDIFNSGALMTGFITDDQGEIITVFVPTGPNPTSGNIYHLQKDRVLKTGAPVDHGMKTIISCGAGSTEIFESRERNILGTENG